MKYTVCEVYATCCILTANTHVRWNKQQKGRRTTVGIYTYIYIYIDICINLPCKHTFQRGVFIFFFHPRGMAQRFAHILLLMRCCLLLFFLLRFFTGTLHERCEKHAKKGKGETNRVYIHMCMCACVRVWMYFVVCRNLLLARNSPRQRFSFPAYHGTAADPHAGHPVL